MALNYGLSPQVSVLLVLVGLCSLQNADGIRFHLAPGTKRCFTDDLPVNRKIQGEVQLANGKGQVEINVRISTLSGNVLYQHRGSDHGKFTFHTPTGRSSDNLGVDSEEYFDPEDLETFEFCVEHYSLGGGAQEIQGRSINFKWDAVPLDGIGAERSSPRAQKESTDNLQLALNNMRRALKAVVGELSALEQRELALVKSHERANSQVMFYAALSIAVAVGVSVFQVRYFRRFFKAKKLL